MWRNYLTIKSFYTLWAQLSSGNMRDMRHCRFDWFYLCFGIAITGPPPISPKQVQMYKVGFYEICLVTSSFVKPWCVTLLKVKNFLRYFLLCSLFFCNPPTFSVLPFRCHKWREEFSLVSGSESDKYSVFSGKSLIVAVKNVQNH